MSLSRINVDAIRDRRPIVGVCRDAADGSGESECFRPSSSLSTIEAVGNERSGSSAHLCNLIIRVGLGIASYLRSMKTTGAKVSLLRATS